MLKVRFNNVNREHQIIEQPNIVQGSQDFISIVISFGTYSGGNFVPTLQYTESDDIQVGAIYTRPDGDKSWFIPFEKQIDGTFTSVLSEWITRENGVLNIDVQVKNIVTGTTNPFTRIKQTILEGTALSGDDWEFGEADYDAIISTQLSHGGRLIALEDEAIRIEDVKANKTDVVKKSGDTMSGVLNMGGNQIKGLADGTASKDAVTKDQLDYVDGETQRLQTEKADQITTYTKNEIANLLLGKLDVEGDGSAKVDMPASIKNRNVVNVEYLLAKILEESLVVDGKLLLKVNTLTEIAGLPIGNGITMDNLVNQLRLANDEAKGLLSAEHYDLLMTLDGLLDNGEDTQFVDTIREVLEILENYPEGANLAQQLGVIEQNILALQNNKANKSITINGLDLSQNRVIHGDRITYDYPQDVRIDNKSVQEVAIETLNKFLNYYLKGETYSAIEIDNKISETLYHGVFIADLGNFTDVDIDQLIDLGGF